MDTGHEANLRRKRVALVGIGGIAEKVYLPLLTGHPDAEIVGIISRSESKIWTTAQQYRIPHTSTDLNDLANWELDAVFIHSATDVHYQMVMDVLQMGLPVYVDKPLSTSFDESREMAARAEENGLLLAVGFNRRFAPLYMQAKSWITEAGGLVQAHAMKHRTHLHHRPARETVYDDLIHMLDLLYWLGDGDGRIRSAELDTDEQGRMLQAFGTLRLGSGIGSYGMVRSAGRDLERLELHGSGRTAIVEDLERASWVQAGDWPQEQVYGSWDNILYRRGFTGAVQHFLDTLDQPQQCAIRAGRVLASHEWAEQAAKSL
ncbi:dehydrogenase [Saccharibacillus sp. O16]|nr:dehydrogenase [Saccharibacillus sp. O16]